MYDTYVVLPEGADEWKQEVIGFVGNDRFQCTVTQDGFYVCFGTKLKNRYSFKKRYSISNMGLVSCNKRFLANSVNAPGLTHDTSLLRHTVVYILDGRVLPDKTIIFEIDMGKSPQLLLEILLAFPRYQWLLKCFSDTTNNPKKKHLKK